MFPLFGPPHLLALAATLLVALLFVAFGRSRRLEPRRRAISWALAAVILLNEIIWHAYQVAHGEWSIASSLPLHLCDAAIILSILALITRRQVPCELVYFWGLGGTVQALITPGITDPFPTYEFFRYFISHAGIVVALAYLTFGLRIRPRPRSVIRSILITIAYAAAVGLIDWLVGGNYMFLCHKPATATLLDLLGPWPWYLIPLAVLGSTVMALLYLPYYLLDQTRSKAPTPRPTTPS